MPALEPVEAWRVTLAPIEPLTRLPIARQESIAPPGNDGSCFFRERRSSSTAATISPSTITAAAGVLDVHETPDPRFLDGLRSDADRLDGLLTLMRQLPRRADAEG